MTIEPKTSPSEKPGQAMLKAGIRSVHKGVISLWQFDCGATAFCRSLSSGGWSRERRRAIAGFVLAEVVICIAIVALVFGGIIAAYIQSARRAEWTGYSLAAQALAIQHIEEIKSCVWDPSKFTCEIDDYCTNLFTWSATSSGFSGYTNWTGYTTNILDLPISGTSFVVATNFVTATCVQLTNISASQVYVYKIRVDTVWPFTWGKTNRLYTNTVINYKAPNNPEAI